MVLTVPAIAAATVDVTAAGPGTHRVTLQKKAMPYSSKGDGYVW
jgi:hypothetical protein